MFHVLNRAVARAVLFATPNDYQAFERILEKVGDRVPMRVLGYCLMPNHWHMLLWPRRDGDLSEYVRLVSVTHAQRWHAVHGTAGTGALYQGRFKSFPVQDNEHLLNVWCYVERNALRARLVSRVEDWPWGSASCRARGSNAIVATEMPLSLPSDWLEHINRPQSEAELAELRQCVGRGSPYGRDGWREGTAARLGIQASLRRRGRPKTTPA